MWLLFLEMSETFVHPLHMQCSRLTLCLLQWLSLCSVLKRQLVPYARLNVLYFQVSSSSSLISILSSSLL